MTTTVDASGLPDAPEPMTRKERRRLAQIARVCQGLVEGTDLDAATLRSHRVRATTVQLTRPTDVLTKDDIKAEKDFERMESFLIEFNSLLQKVAIKETELRHQQNAYKTSKEQLAKVSHHAQQLELKLRAEKEASDHKIARLTNAAKQTEDHASLAKARLETQLARASLDGQNRVSELRRSSTHQALSHAESKAAATATISNLQDQVESLNAKLSESKAGLAEAAATAKRRIGEATTAVRERDVARANNERAREDCKALRTRLAEQDEALQAMETKLKMQDTQRQCDIKAIALLERKYTTASARLVEVKGLVNVLRKDKAQALAELKAAKAVAQAAATTAAKEVWRVDASDDEGSTTCLSSEDDEGPQRPRGWKRRRARAVGSRSEAVVVLKANEKEIQALELENKILRDGLLAHADATEGCQPDGSAAVVRPVFDHDAAGLVVVQPLYDQSVTHRGLNDAVGRVAAASRAFWTNNNDGNTARATDNATTASATPQVGGQGNRARRGLVFQEGGTTPDSDADTRDAQFTPQQKQSRGNGDSPTPPGLMDMTRSPPNLGHKRKEYSRNHRQYLLPQRDRIRLPHDTTYNPCC